MLIADQLNLLSIILNSSAPVKFLVLAANEFHFFGWQEHRLNFFFIHAIPVAALECSHAQLPDMGANQFFHRMSQYRSNTPNLTFTPFNHDDAQYGCIGIFFDSTDEAWGCPCAIEPDTVFPLDQCVRSWLAIHRDLIG